MCVCVYVCARVCCTGVYAHMPAAQSFPTVCDPLPVDSQAPLVMEYSMQAIVEWFLLQATYD